MKNCASAAAEIALALTEMGWEQKGQFYTARKTVGNCYFARCKLKGHSALFYRYERNVGCFDFVHFRYLNPDSVNRAITHARQV